MTIAYSGAMIARRLWSTYVLHEVLDDVTSAPTNAAGC